MNDVYHACITEDDLYISCSMVKMCGNFKTFGVKGLTLEELLLTWTSFSFMPKLFWLCCQIYCQKLPIQMFILADENKITLLVVQKINIIIKESFFENIQSM